MNGFIDVLYEDTKTKTNKMPCSKCKIDGHNVRTCKWKKPKKTNKLYESPILKRNIKDCCVCYEQLETGNGTVTTPCGHNYCAPCFANWMRKSGTCAYCRENVCDPPRKKQPISEEGQGQIIDELLDCDDLMIEIKFDIHKQIIAGIYERCGKRNGIEQIIEDIMEKNFNPDYIMSIVGYDAIDIVSKYYRNE